MHRLIRIYVYTHVYIQMQMLSSPLSEFMEETADRQCNVSDEPNVHEIIIMRAKPSLVPDFFHFHLGPGLFLKKRRG